MNLSLANDPLGRKVSGRPLRYLLAAGLNTIFGLGIYPVLLWTVPWFRIHYLIALLIAQAISLCFAYSSYKLGVFQTRGGYAREITAFVSFYGVNYAANWIALPAMVEVAHIPPIIGQLMFSAVIIVTSYFWHSKVTFRGAT